MWSPRDQELRFIVHDSPDYYQLKLSVFNDDKKTELIGEAWIDLRDIIVTGGGQSDDWQTLTCKGKYAGDIRIEITFYDSRPKPEKQPVAKPKPVDGEHHSPSQQKVPKRRPLPSDPLTGQAPAQASPVVGHPAAPARPHAHSQSAQYGNPPSLRGRHRDNYSPGAGSGYHDPAPRAVHSGYPDDTFAPEHHHGHNPDVRYGQAAPYGGYPTDPAYGSGMDDERPPPPPAHRSQPGAAPDAKVMRKDVLRQEALRQPDTSNAYPGRPVYRAHDSAPASVPSANDPYGAMPQQLSQPRHHSYDAHYESHHRSLQPTVEDVPDSPGSGLVDEYGRRGSHSHAPAYDDVVYRNDPSPAPLNLSGRSSAPSLQYGASHGQSASPDYTRSEISSRASTSQISYDGRSSYTSYSTAHEAELPAVPTSLIPGMDPSMMEISQRINDTGRHERRHTQPYAQNPPAGSMRGRQMVDMPPSYNAPPRDSSQHYNPQQQSHDVYDRTAVLYNGGAPAQYSPSNRDISPGHSPGGQSTIRRKSVSPAPPVESRRLSGVPFGPDSYDALNPALSGSKPKDLPSQDYDEINGKIITHDGREVDPSDHLPMDTWAPEPEPKAGKRSSLDSNSRPALSGPQPPPPSGRKPLRIRPASSLPPATYISPENKSTLPPPSTGRNRLQKRANRASASPAMMSGANGPGPNALSPLSQPPQERDSFVPRPPARASTFDYENYAPPPMYDMPPPSHYSGGRDHSASAPPIPAKIPLAAAGQGNSLVPMGYSHGGGGHGGGAELTLMEEMSRIDIGSGRARRHTQRPAIGGY